VAEPRHVTDAVCSPDVDLLGFAHQSRSSDVVVQRDNSPLGKTPTTQHQSSKPSAHLRNEPAFFRIEGLKEQIFGLNEQVRRRGPKRLRDIRPYPYRRAEGPNSDYTRSANLPRPSNGWGLLVYN
jgi:hypothetical protein